MSRQLYEEALADVKQLKAIAEKNARNAVMDAVTPRIREMIEKKLFETGAAIDIPTQDDADRDKEKEDSLLLGDIGHGGGTSTMPVPPEALPSDVETDMPLEAVPPPLPPAAPAVELAPIGLGATVVAGPTLKPNSTLETLPTGATKPVGAPAATQPPAVPQPGPFTPPPSSTTTATISPTGVEFATDGTEIDSLEGLSVQLSDIESRLTGIEKSVCGAEKCGEIDGINATIGSVEDMYESVQLHVKDVKRKSLLEARLEKVFDALQNFKEKKMSKKRINEDATDATATGDAAGVDAGAEKGGGTGEVTLKLTGLPADLDIENVGVDLITGEDDEAGDLEPGTDAASGTDDLDIDLGAGGGGDASAAGGGGTSTPTESRLRGDQIVEIDENELKEAINQMRKERMTRLNEAEYGDTHLGAKHGSTGDGSEFGGGKKDSKGKPEGRKVSKTGGDDFGGGKRSSQKKPTGEEELKGGDEDGETHLDKHKQHTGTGKEFGGGKRDSLRKPVGGKDGSEVIEIIGEGEEGKDKYCEKCHKLCDSCACEESACSEAEEKVVDEAEVDEYQDRRKADEFGREAADSHSVSAESIKRRIRFEERMQERMVRNIKECTDKGLRARIVSRLDESKMKVAELKKNVDRSNSDRQPGEGEALRAKLSELNLYNAKLLHTNKLLQNDSLSAKQKANVIQKLDEARSLREVKLVYESLMKMFDPSGSKNLEENARRVVGSASRPTRSTASSVTLNESSEALRWAKLAGIVK